MTITGDQLQRELTGTARTLAEAKGIAIKFKGDQACTNGEFIQLPAVDLQREFTPEEVLVLRGYVDHEAAHVTDTELALMEHVNKAHGRNTGVLMNAIEDMRIERKAISRLPRVKHNLNAVGTFLNAGMPADYKPTLRADAATAITWLGRAAEGYAKSGEELVNRMDADEREIIERYTSRLNTLTSTRDSMALALEMMGELKESGEDEQPQPPQGDAGEGDESQSDDAGEPQSGDAGEGESDQGDEENDAGDESEGDAGEGESDEGDESESDAGESDAGDAGEGDAGEGDAGEGDESDEDFETDAGDADATQSGDTDEATPESDEGEGESEGESDAPEGDEVTDSDSEGAGGYGNATGEQSQNEDLDLKSADLNDAIESLLAQEAPEADVGPASSTRLCVHAEVRFGLRLPPAVVADVHRRDLPRVRPPGDQRDQPQPSRQVVALPSLPDGGRGSGETVYHNVVHARERPPGRSVVAREVEGRLGCLAGPGAGLRRPLRDLLGRQADAFGIDVGEGRLGGGGGDRQAELRLHLHRRHSRIVGGVLLHAGHPADPRIGLRAAADTLGELLVVVSR